MRHLLNRAAPTAVATAVLVALGSAPGLAQDSSADELALEEIVVTARKREEALQDVPLTVTAVGATKIQELGIRDARELALYVPGFSNIASFGRNSSERAPDHPWPIEHPRRTERVLLHRRGLHLGKRDEHRNGQPRTYRGD